MTVTAVSSPMPAMQASRAPEAKEGRGPDHDGDADDKNVSTATGSVVSAAAPQGMGTAVDTKV